MNHRIELNKMDPTADYEGYLWWSNEESPDIYRGEPVKSRDKKTIWPTNTDNPFIVEGNLWNKKEETSYLIRFIDGEYLVYEFDMKNIDPSKITRHKYLPNRMPGIEKLMFTEVWEEQSDPYCNNFNVLKPAFIAFVGFEKQEEKQ